LHLRLALLLGRRLVAAEEGTEDAVVGVELVLARDERRAACPVQILGGQERGGADEALDPPGSDAQPFRAERAAERRQLLDRTAITQ
jgi:hypothetical protein